MVFRSGRLQYRLGVEDIEPDHGVAWVLELPACFSSATTQQEATAQVPTRIGEYFDWLKGNEQASPLANEPIETEAPEVSRSFTSQNDYTVNAFFEGDRKPLDYEEVEYHLWLLDRTRRDLLAVVRQLPRETLNRPVAREVRGSILGILSHVAGAENWYLDRPRLALPDEEMPEEPLARLERVRVHTKARLPELVDDARVVELVGEQWSVRKVLRRALWHERDHTNHIAQLAGVRG